MPARPNTFNAHLQIRNHSFDSSVGRRHVGDQRNVKLLTAESGAAAFPSAAVPEYFKHEFRSLLLSTAVRPWLQFVYAVLLFTIARQLILSFISWLLCGQFSMIVPLQRLWAAFISVVVFGTLLVLRFSFISPYFRLQRRRNIFSLRQLFVVDLTTLLTSTGSTKDSKQLKPSATNTTQRIASRIFNRFILLPLFGFSLVLSPLSLFLVLSGAAPSKHFDVCCILLTGIISCRRFFEGRQNVLHWGLITTSPGMPSLSADDIMTRAAKASVYTMLLAFPLYLTTYIWGCRSLFAIFHLLFIDPCLIITGITEPSSMVYVGYRVAVLFLTMSLIYFCLELHGDELFRLIHMDFGIDPVDIPVILGGSFTDRMLAASTMAKAVSSPPSSFPSNYVMYSAGSYIQSSDTLNISTNRQEISRPLTTEIRFTSSSSAVSSSSQTTGKGSGHAGRPKVSRFRLISFWGVLGIPKRFAWGVAIGVARRVDDALPSDVSRALALWRRKGMFSLRPSWSEQRQSGTFSKHAGSLSGIVLNNWLLKVLLKGQDDDQKIWRAYTAEVFNTMRSTAICLEVLGRFTANSSGLLPLDLAYQLQLLLELVYTLDEQQLYRNPFTSYPLKERLKNIISRLFFPSWQTRLNSEKMQNSKSVGDRQLQGPSSRNAMLRSRMQMSEGPSRSRQDAVRSAQERCYYGYDPDDSAATQYLHRPQTDGLEGSSHMAHPSWAMRPLRAVPPIPAAVASRIQGEESYEGAGLPRRPTSSEKGGTGLLSASDLEGMSLGMDEKQDIFVQLQEMSLPFVELSILFVRGLSSWMHIIHFFSPDSRPSKWQGISQKTPLQFMQRLVGLQRSISDLLTAVATSYTFLAPEMHIHLHVLETEVLTAISTIALLDGLPLARSDVEKSIAKVVNSLAKINGVPL